VEVLQFVSVVVTPPMIIETGEAATNPDASDTYLGKVNSTLEP